MKRRKTSKGAVDSVTGQALARPRRQGSPSKMPCDQGKPMDAEESSRFKEEGIGILICCGRELRWRRDEGSSVFEAECENCGTSYAMDRG